MAKSSDVITGKKLRRNKVLLVRQSFRPHDSVIQATTEKNVIKVTITKHKDKQLFKRENMMETDMIEGGGEARNTTSQDYKAMVRNLRAQG